MSQDTHFDDRILAVCVLPASLVGFYSFFTFEKVEILNSIGITFVFWLLTVLVMTVILAPIAWYQQLRLGYALPRSLTAFIVLGGLTFAAALSWAIQMITPLNMALQILFVLGLPFTLIGIYTERKRMKELKSYKFDTPINTLPR